MQDKLIQVRALISDVDGVLTDGSIVISEMGEVKTFNVRDGWAIKVMQRAGLMFAILSGRKSEPVLRRAKELDIEVVKTGRLDKQTAMNEIAATLGLSLGEMAYIGDDIPDLAPMAMARISFCPQDAVPEVLAQADVVVPVDGGRGVVRAAIELILKAQGRWEQEVERCRVK